jgi:hypothetical protein
MIAEGLARVAAYAFEAKGVQAFILAGGRLRDIVGASLLVDSLCLEALPNEEAPRGVPPARGLLDAALAASGLKPGPRLRFTRRAAGAFALVAVGPEARALDDFRRLWTLLVTQAAPGLEFIDMIGAGATAPEALRAALAQGQGRRSRLAVPFPLAPPPARRAPRTGLGAVALDGNHRDEPPEPVDAATKRKRVFFSGHRARRRWWSQKPDEFDWPTDFDEEFPFLGEDRTVAVLHADGNRMGQILIGLEEAAARDVSPDDLPADDYSPAETAYLERLLSFSENIGDATQQAFDTACAAYLEPAARKAMAAKAKQTKAPVTQGFLPGRPIIMGGDDLAVILRGDLALDFAQSFLDAFESDASERLKSLHEDLPDLPPLTACAGLALVNAGQPFDRALALAEDLCRHAKSAAKAASRVRTSGDTGRVPSSLAFHRATAALLETYGETQEHELTVWNGNGEAAFILTMQPYAVGDCDSMGLPHLDDLRKLRDLFGEGVLGRGAAREIIALLQAAPAQARLRYARWRQVLGCGTEEQKKALTLFDNALEKIGTAAEKHFGPGASGETFRTPLGDAITWHIVTRVALRDAPQSDEVEA